MIPACTRRNEKSILNDKSVTVIFMLVTFLVNILIRNFSTIPLDLVLIDTLRTA